MGAPTGWATMASLAVVVLFASCCCRCCGGACTDVERRALMELKNSFNYPNGSAMPTWGGGRGGDEDCCRWSGVTCDNSTGRVVGIELSRQGAYELGSTWYPNLTMLTHLRELQVLDLGDKQIGGWAFAKALCELGHLKELNLEYNLLEGIPPPEFYICLCQMRSLTRLYLAGNQIQGSLPPCLCNVSSLASLQLYNNRLQGNIPPCLGNLHSLEDLMLGNNEFVGSIPPSIFHNMTNLKWVEIGSDQMEGKLELSVFANLSKLAFLHLLSDHGLEIETETSSWVPSFQLQGMSIRGCMINKRSGYQVPSFISTQHRLTALRLYDSSLAGRLPPWLFCNSSLYGLYLGRNLLRDTFPQPCHNSSSNIECLEISRNRIYGSLPDNIGSLFPHLTQLAMSTNEMEGQLPPSLGRTPLRILDFGDNNLRGELPPALTRNATMLEWVNLSNNQLEGEMLPKDSSMPRLKFLYLGGNNFTGPLSPRISNSSLLKVIDVSGNNLRCDISSCLPALGSEISGLLLRENSLQGYLPSQLCQMANLQFLDIAANNLSGKIPPCLNNISVWKSSTYQGLSQNIWQDASEGFLVAVVFTSKYNQRSYMGGPLPLMTGLDLSLNRLDGSIPPEIGGLKWLQTLNLSNNHLQGPIPMSFSNLLSIESLDLSHNYLSGAIPQELARLSFLAIFSVAYNDLSGVIPSGRQFSSFSESSYEGNVGLCGPPLARSCSSKSTDQPGGEEHGVLENDRLFYMFLALSYVLGLGCFSVILLLNWRWRVQYFKAIDMYYDLYVRKFTRNPS